MNIFFKLDFYPRSPCGERHPLKATKNSSFHNFYPRSPCGERQLLQMLFRQTTQISIHALLAESDAFIMIITICIALFLSTLSLRRATHSKDIDQPEQTFLSTLSLRRATTASSIAIFSQWDFYPRSPCGERLCGACGSGANRGISIHALLAESDTSRLHKNIYVWGFLSTLSLRRATRIGAYSAGFNIISIHALLAESDLVRQYAVRI